MPLINGVDLFRYSFDSEMLGECHMHVLSRMLTEMAVVNSSGNKGIGSAN